MRRPKTDSAYDFRAHAGNTGLWLEPEPFGEWRLQTDDESISSQRKGQFASTKFYLLRVGIYSCHLACLYTLSSLSCP